MNLGICSSEARRKITTKKKPAACRAFLTLLAAQDRRLVELDRGEARRRLAAGAMRQGFGAWGLGGLGISSSFGLGLLGSGRLWVQGSVI